MAKELGLADHIETDAAAIEQAGLDGVIVEQRLMPMVDEKGNCVNQDELDRQAAQEAAGELVLVTDINAAHKLQAAQVAEIQPVVNAVVKRQIDLKSPTLAQDLALLLVALFPEQIEVIGE